MNGCFENDRAVILVIDDESEIIASLAQTLTTAGYSCHCCRDPQSALDLVDQITPDLIISDINLAGHSGLKLCQEIKQRAGLSDTPWMFLSGAQIPDIIRRAHQAGGTYYLRKPFDPNVLLELVDKALWMPHLVAGRAGM